ncbi:hypothetical protein ACO2Q3_21290 [Caulobacter sp. KR2-114]|uniref:hypothetical protein n=1 Tax=Caulobacter sp. KR2-114 TaxID=3400912 RepID=UPI003C03A32E
MSVAPVASTPAPAAYAAVKPPEAAEKGPDMDHDGDEPAKAAAAPNTGLKVDITA